MVKKNYSIDVSIVICSYNTKNLLKRLLESIFSYLKNVKYEVIVVDDASSDASVTMIKKFFPSVTIIQNTQNMGYTKSCNKGTVVSKGQYILQLNSDTFFEKKTDFKKIIDYLNAHKNVAIAGCKVLELDGKLDPTCKHSFPNLRNMFFLATGLALIYPKNEILGEYYLMYLDENKIAEVDCLGAFMMIRREVIEKVGLMDERFFIYAEDIDYCLRVKQAGWKIIYYPGIVIRHHHGASTSKAKLLSIFRFHRSLYLYYQKYFAKKNNMLLNYVVYLGLIARFALFYFKELVRSI